ncbi:MAG TPA: PKD domain-containing protein, partial [Patescibacteria group bacterium]|nr:PKD domain-containing protein [Patescibacteria group bacterium]
MKKLIQAIIVHLLLFVVLSSTSYSQCMMYEVSLSDRIHEAELIVEGKVLDEHSYWNKSRSMIYTSYLIEIFSVVKGNIAVPHLEIQVEGGIVGNEQVEVVPGVIISKNTGGIFFLKKLAGEFISANPERFTIVAGMQGIIRYDRFLKAEDPYKKYSSPEEIFKQINVLTKQKNYLKKNEERQRFFSEKSADFTNPAGNYKKPYSDRILAPSISGFAPTTISAGTFTTLTINGSDFGNTVGTVEFRNADNGGTSYVPAPANHIQSWTNTQIRVWVPMEAGTGTIRITNSAGEQGVSTSILTIPYSHLNVTAQNGTRSVIDLVDSNTTGGYTFTMNSAFASNTSAADAYRRALQTWRCGTYVNFRLSNSTTSVTCNVSDNINVVSFDNSNCALPTGTLGVTYSYRVGCGNPLNWYLREVDQIYKAVAPGGGWNFGPGTTSQNQYDFQSVATHEIGHAHQLGHIIAPGRVMHFAIANGTDLRAVNIASDIAGGNAVMERSIVNNSCGPAAMVPLTDASCSISAPVANFSATPLSGCSPLTVQFTDGSGGATSWLWTFSNGITSTLQNPTVTFQNPGTYSATLVVTNASGSGTITKTNYVTVFSNPQAVAGTDRNICSGSSTQIGGIATAGQPPYSYFWSPAQGLNSTTSATPTASPEETTQYTVTVTDANGCIGTASVVVTVQPLPMPTIATSKTSLCFGETALLDAGSTYSAYLWSNGATTSTITVAQSGQYSVRVTDTNGCSATSQPVTITVNPRPAPSLSGPTAVCPNTTATYTAATLQAS